MEQGRVGTLKDEGNSKVALALGSFKTKWRGWIGRATLNAGVVDKGQR